MEIQSREIEKFNPFRTKIALLQKKVDNLKITNKFVAEQSKDLGLKIKDTLQDIELTRKSLVEDYNNYVKNVNKYSKSFSEPLEIMKKNIH